jgi:DNA-binding LytR/AlgR family response regulator
MLIVGICDDNKKDINLIKDSILKNLFDMDDIVIREFSSGGEVISAISRDSFDCNLLLLDIVMHPVDGLETAEFIRSNKVDVDIIFVTNSAEYVYKGYFYKAFAYVLKETVNTVLIEEIKRYYKELCKSEECLNVTSDGLPRRIPISMIRYMESSSRKIILHLTNEDIAFYAKMNDIETVMQEKGFVRVHQSYMVRLDEIVSLSSDSLTLNCGAVVSVSRKYYAELKNMWHEKTA